MDSEFHKALRGGNRVSSSHDQSSRVVIADYRAVSAPEDLAAALNPRDPVLSHRCFSHSCKGQWKCFLKKPVSTYRAKANSAGVMVYVTVRKRLHHDPCDSRWAEIRELEMSK